MGKLGSVSVLRTRRLECLFMSCSVFMSALGRSIDNDSAALKSHFFMAFGNLHKDEDMSQKASQNKE
jgi:hypothetical protein